ncbi:MAG: hypothetical protein U1E93_13415 [Alphaproteobacteria bacterium]
MFGIKSVVAAVTVATMIGSSAFAADGAFAPGKPAGVNHAQEIGTGTLILAGAGAAIIAGVAITVSNQSGDRAPATSTFAPATTNAATP